MTAQSQRNASNRHRRRAAAKGLVRVEVQAAAADTGLIRRLAEALRGDPDKAEAIRGALSQALSDPSRPKTAFDVFGSDLPDEAFSGVFDQPRPQFWREIDM